MVKSPEEEKEEKKKKQGAAAGLATLTANGESMDIDTKSEILKTQGQDKPKLGEYLGDF